MKSDFLSAMRWQIADHMARQLSEQEAECERWLVSGCFLNELIIMEQQVIPQWAGVVLNPWWLENKSCLD